MAHKQVSFHAWQLATHEKNPCNCTYENAW